MARRISTLTERPGRSLLLLALLFAAVVFVALPYHWGLPILSAALFGLFRHGIDRINLTATASARLEPAVTGSWPADKECHPCPSSRDCQGSFIALSTPSGAR